MSGSTIGGAIGAVVGFYFGGPQGAQIGWMVGSAVGGYVDPEQIQGPRLQDARTQTSRDGIAIPFGWGTFPLAGNVIAQGPVVEHKKKERQGKGGPEVTSYTYTRTYAIGLCEGPITGILQVKRNGKLVYDARNDDLLIEEFTRKYTGIESVDQKIAMARAANAAFVNKATFYLGDETQMPDPALEAIFGAGNVPAHRGLAYFVVEDDDVTDLAGAIPQYEVVVAGSGTATATDCGDIGGRVFAGTNSSEMFISNGGGTWSDSNKLTGSDFSSVYTANSAIFALGSTPKVSFDNGQSFQAISGLSGTSRGICHDGVSYWAVVGGDLYKSADGLSFSSVSLGGAAARSNPVAFGGAILVGCTGGNIARVTTGDVVEVYSIGGVNDIQCLLVSNLKVMAIRVLTGAIAVSNSGASGTWENRSHPLQTLTASAPSGAADGEGRAVVTSVEGDSMFTDDGGDNWTLGGNVGFLMSNQPAEKLAFVQNLDAPGLFIAVGDGGQIGTSNSGGAWTLAFTHPLGTQFYSVAAMPSLEAGLIELPDAPGYYVNSSGDLVSACVGGTVDLDKVPLATIVADVCERRGIDASEYDVSQLTDLVTGFVVGRETDAASIIQSLAPAYFFDPAEWDAKLRFIKRGGTAVGAINGDDLVERDGDAFERERVQEAELLRRVTVGYNDPQAAYALTTQKWERRAGTVQALGEASVELPLTLEADDAATIAKRRGLVAWGEPEKQKFSLPYRLGKYTPTDIIAYTDDDGLVHTIRLMDLQDDSGVRYVESSMNSAEAYGATATGVVPRPPSITEPALRGPTLLAVMDLPLWRSSDSDTLGLYVAGCGYLGGWQGAQVDVSTDGGVSYSEAAQVTIPATIGTTTSALAAWVSSEYPSVQSVTVTLPDAPESVSYEALLRYNNRAAIQLDSGEWAILQYQTAVANGGNSYTLSGILHGRYATTPGAAAAGARFVLLDAAVQFVPVERHLLGTTFKVRATTYGTSSDAAVAADFTFTAGASQAEWPVHGVTATRDGSDNVTVTWIGRARFGTETAPYHSANFTGYRVTYSDGQTFDVGPAVTTHTRSSAPVSQTITVRPLNAITGAGPASTGITV